MTERGSFNGTTDTALSERGRLEAASLKGKIPKLEWAGVWASGLRRAGETAALAGYEVVCDERLNEFDFGELEGLTWDDLDPDTARRMLAFDDYAAPGGESVPQLRARLDSFVADLAAGDHLVFTHGGVIRALLRERHRDRRVDPGAIDNLDL